MVMLLARDGKISNQGFKIRPYSENEIMKVFILGH